MRRIRLEVVPLMHDSRKDQSSLVGQRSGRATCLALFLLPLLFGACVGPTEQVESLIWEGSLQPVGDVSVLVTGSVAMVSGQFNTQIGIGVEGGDPGSVLQWNVRRGDCGEEGEPLVNLSVFPAIDVGNTGEGSSNVVLSGRVSNSQSFAARVSLSAAAASPVACGVLTRQD